MLEVSQWPLIESPNFPISSLITSQITVGEMVDGTMSLFTQRTSTSSMIAKYTCYVILTVGTPRVLMSPILRNLLPRYLQSGLENYDHAHMLRSLHVKSTSQISMLASRNFKSAS